VPPADLAQVQSDYLKNVTDIWNQSLARLQPDGKARPVSLGDRRFAGQEWLQNPAAAYTAQMYLLNARTLMQMAECGAGRREDPGAHPLSRCSSGSTPRRRATSWPSTPKR
jgi:hypothetical protein